jgi:hypothetical protein
MTNNTKRLTKEELDYLREENEAEEICTWYPTDKALVERLLDERAEAVRLLGACRSELETDPNAGEYYADLIAELKAFES